MPTERYTAQQLRRRKGRVRRKVLAATTEADIARQAREDRSSTSGEDVRKWRRVTRVARAML